MPTMTCPDCGADLDDVDVADSCPGCGGSSLPPLGIVALMQFNVVTPSLGLALGLAAALLVIDGLAWRVVATMFNRERLVTGGRS